jgi:hypothetical protein
MEERNQKLKIKKHEEKGEKRTRMREHGGRKNNKRNMEKYGEG